MKNSSTVCGISLGEPPEVVDLPPTQHAKLCEEGAIFTPGSTLKILAWPASEVTFVCPILRDFFFYFAESLDISIKKKKRKKEKAL